MARQGKAWPGEDQGMDQGNAGRGAAGLGLAGRGMAWHGVARIKERVGIGPNAR
jgi:hypothetical protein